MPADHLVINLVCEGITSESFVGLIAQSKILQLVLPQLFIILMLVVRPEYDRPEKTFLAGDISPSCPPDGKQDSDRRRNGNDKSAYI